MSKICSTFAVLFHICMQQANDIFYTNRHSVNELCCDYPADKSLVEGLYAMQMHLVNRGVRLTIPVLNVMNTAHYIAACMMQTGAEGCQCKYDALAYMRLGHDAQVAMLAIMVLATMLKRTDGQRARLCRSVLMEGRSEDFYEGLSLYERYISSSEQRFSEEDFLTDVMRQITDLQNTVQQLTQERQQLKQQIDTMSKTPKHQTTVYNYGTYNDIHDNPHATIYATAPQAEPTKQASTVEPEDATQAEYFCRITEAAISAGKAQQIDNELRSAAVSAPKLIKAIRTNEALGYLDTKNLSSTELYNLLNEHYDLPFKYRQFAQERNK